MAVWHDSLTYLYVDTRNDQTEVNDMSKQYEGNGADALADAIARYTEQGYKPLPDAAGGNVYYLDSDPTIEPHNHALVSIWMRDEDGRVYSDEY